MQRQRRNDAHGSASSFESSLLFICCDVDKKKRKKRKKKKKKEKKEKKWKNG